MILIQSIYPIIESDEHVLRFIARKNPGSIVVSTNTKKDKPGRELAVYWHEEKEIYVDIHVKFHMFHIDPFWGEDNLQLGIEVCAEYRHGPLVEPPNATLTDRLGSQYVKTYSGASFEDMFKKMQEEIMNCHLFVSGYSLKPKDTVGCQVFNHKAILCSDCDMMEYPMVCGKHRKEERAITFPTPTGPRYTTTELQIITIALCMYSVQAGKDLHDVIEKTGLLLKDSRNCL